MLDNVLPWRSSNEWGAFRLSSARTASINSTIADSAGQCSTTIGRILSARGALFKPISKRRIRVPSSILFAAEVAETFCESLTTSLSASYRQLRIYQISRPQTNQAMCDENEKIHVHLEYNRYHQAEPGLEIVLQLCTSHNALARSDPVCGYSRFRIQHTQSSKS